MRSQAVLGSLVVVIILTDATGQHMDDLINNENKDDSSRYGKHRRSISLFGSAIIKGWKARKIMLAGAKEVPSGNAHVRRLTKQGDIIDLKRDLSHLPNKPLKVIRIKGTDTIKVGNKLFLVRKGPNGEWTLVIAKASDVRLYGPTNLELPREEITYVPRD